MKITTSQKPASSSRKLPSPGRSTTNTPPGLSADPTPTTCVRIDGGSRGARFGVKLLMRVPSRSSSTVSRPACSGACGGSSQPLGGSGPRAQQPSAAAAATSGPSTTTRMSELDASDCGSSGCSASDARAAASASSPSSSPMLTLPAALPADGDVSRRRRPSTKRVRCWSMARDSMFRTWGWRQSGQA